MGDNRMICANGHYYDGSKYTKCPHCADGLARIESSVFTTENEKNKKESKIEQKKDGKRGFFLGKRKEKQEIEQDTKTVVEQVGQKKSNVEQLTKNDVEKHDLTKGLYSVTHDTKSQKAVEPVQAVESKALSEVFAQAVTPPKSVIDKDKTVSFFSTGGKTEPPVGYLICTAGEDFGCGFLLKSGNNAIGRGQSMDVVLMDPKVSREKQAFVMYEPKNRKFFLKPGEGSGLCYLNGEVVLSPIEIHPFDKVGLGDTELMLIAVCCEQFGWEDCQVGGE